jgi:hypothetical protein
MSLADFADCAPCSAHVQFYRHECSRQLGRTRSIQLKDMTYTSPELWVTWHDDELTVITRDAAEFLVSKGEPVEFEAVLAGKFSFTWKTGVCAKCGLLAASEGVFRDARPQPVTKQGDLAVFTQGQQLQVTKGVMREHE